VHELIEYIARALVTQPDQVLVTEADENGVLVFQLKVAPEDMGKVIGRQGRIANAIRTVLKVAAVRQGQRVVLEIL
jgi:predicted RNA-binding protein YlqC (UPF0109 family)